MLGTYDNQEAALRTIAPPQQDIMPFKCFMSLYCNGQKNQYGVIEENSEICLSSQCTLRVFRSPLWRRELSQLSKTSLISLRNWSKKRAEVWKSAPSCMWRKTSDLHANKRAFLPAINLSSFLGYPYRIIELRGLLLTLPNTRLAVNPTQYRAVEVILGTWPIRLDSRAKWSWDSAVFKS